MRVTTSTIRFRIPHVGHSFPCRARVRQGQIISLKLEVLEIFDDESTKAWCAVEQKVRFLDELLHSGLKWRALVTARSSPGLFGAIVEAAEQRVLESNRPYRTPEQAA